MGQIHYFGLMLGRKGRRALCDRLSKPYNIVANRLAIVVEKYYVLGWTFGDDPWKWWRPLFTWKEKMLEEYNALLYL